MTADLAPQVEPFDPFSEGPSRDYADAMHWERMLLGAVLAGYPDVAALSHEVSGPDFYNPAHELVWDCALALYLAGQKITPNSVRYRLGVSQCEKLPGGALFLANVTSQPELYAREAPMYATQVRDRSIRRQIRNMGTSAHQAADEDLDVPRDVILGRLNSWMDQFTSTARSDLMTAEKSLQAVIELAEKGEQRSIATPWKGLNELLTGWFPGQLVVLGARPSVGKSLFLENAATGVADWGLHSLLVSLEMSAEELTQRTLSHTARVELTRIRRGGKYLTEQDWGRIRDSYRAVAERKITVADRGGQTMLDIRSATMAAAQAARRDNSRLGMVAIDYCQLIESTSHRLTRQQQIGEFTRGLKRLAKEHETTVLLAAQLKRSQREGRPVMEDLREAGDLENDADVVILLHEITETDGDGTALKTGEVELLVEKQRNGPTGVRSVQKWGHYARLSDS